MKLTITGYDENTGLFAYTTQEVVYGSMSRTYSLRPPVVGFIDGDLVKVIGEIAKLGDRSSEAWQKLPGEERIIATLYADLYQGDVSVLIGAGYTQAVHGLELVPPVPTRLVDLPTAADLGYIDKNAGPVWKAQGDADHYCLLDEKGHWVAAIHLNGEMSTHAQEEWLNRYFRKG